MPSLCPKEDPGRSQVSVCWTAVYMAVIAKVGLGQVIWPTCLMMQPQASAVIFLLKLPKTKLHYCTSNH